MDYLPACAGFLDFQLFYATVIADKRSPVTCGHEISAQPTPDGGGDGGGFKFRRLDMRRWNESDAAAACGRRPIGLDTTVEMQLAPVLDLLTHRDADQTLPRRTAPLAMSLSGVLCHHPIVERMRLASLWLPLMHVIRVLDAGLRLRISVLILQRRNGSAKLSAFALLHAVDPSTGRIRPPLPTGTTVRSGFVEVGVTGPGGAPLQVVASRFELLAVVNTVAVLRFWADVVDGLVVSDPEDITNAPASGFRLTASVIGVASAASDADAVLIPRWLFAGGDDDPVARFQITVEDRARGLRLWHCVDVHEPLQVLPLHVYAQPPSHPPPPDKKIYKTT